MSGPVAFIVSFCAFLVIICQTAQGSRLPPPTHLSAKWIDSLVVNVSWSAPKDLPKGCEVHFTVTRTDRQPIRTSRSFFLEDLLTETRFRWTYSVVTVGVSPSCKDQSSEEKHVGLEAPKNRADMKECKCHLFADSMNCSWIPNPKRAPLSLSYRECGSTLKLIKMNFTKCQRTNHIGPKRVCHLTGNFLQKDLCMVAESPDALSTFRAPKAVKLPEKMEISEEGSNLVLKLMPLDVVIPSSVYYISYSICDKNLDMEYPIGDQSKTIPYDKSCQYKFRYQARFTRYSLQFYSDWSEEFVYGSTDRTLTVVAVVIPIIVSVCVILSCVCFRRHKDIICPDVPDPSTIFKEMINGNKEMKPKVHMYKPVLEPIEPITIVPHIPAAVVSGPVPT